MNLEHKGRFSNLHLCTFKYDNDNKPQINIFNNFFSKLTLRLKSKSYTLFFKKIGFQKNNFRKTSCKQPGFVQKTVLGIAMIKKSLLLFPDITLSGLLKIWECLLYGCYILLLHSKIFTKKDSSNQQKGFIDFTMWFKQLQVLTRSNLKGCP